MRLGRYSPVMGITLVGIVFLADSPTVQARARRVPVKSAAPVEGPTTLGRVADVRFWSLGEVTRVAIEVDAEFEYKSDRLNNPDRLFFDIANVKPQVRKSIQTIPVGDALVKQIRVAETLPGTTRIVLDLEASADFTVSRLTSPERLIVEIRAGSRRDSPLAPQPALSESRPRKVFVPPPASVHNRANNTPAKIDAPPRLIARLETATPPAAWSLPTTWSPSGTSSSAPPRLRSWQGRSGDPQPREALERPCKGREWAAQEPW